MLIGEHLTLVDGNAPVPRWRFFVGTISDHTIQTPKRLRDAFAPLRHLKRATAHNS